MGPDKHEEINTFRWSVGKTDARFPILVCALNMMGASDLYEQFFYMSLKLEHISYIVSDPFRN